MLMKCPACARIDNPYGAQACKCGYAFEGPQTEPTAVLASIERSARTIKNILVWWFVITLTTAALYLIVRLVALSS
jgi:hypothetical protein